VEHEAPVSTSTGRFGPNSEKVWGSHAIESLFPDETPITQTAWPSATRSRKRFDYDKEKVVDAVRQHLWTPHLEQVDPRELHATQPAVTRAGVQHYMRPNPRRYADTGQAGNVHPVVYKRDDGVNLLLSGTHRGHAALLQGRQLDAVVVEGSWGKDRNIQ
jgi:hypothetical protein